MTAVSPPRPLYRRRFAAISRLVNVRAFFAMLIAAAMLFAPLAMSSGAAMAMAPADHHGQMMAKGQCDDNSSDGQDVGTVGKSCCVAMCAAVALAPAAPIEQHDHLKAEPAATLQNFQFGFFGELPTPPPRGA